MFSQIYKILSNFDSNSLICDPTLFPGKKSPNIEKYNCAFPGKVRGDRVLILTYLDSPMTEGFPHYCLPFSVTIIFRRERVVIARPKVQILGPSLFHENTNPLIFFRTMFLFDRVEPLVRILAISDHI